MQRTISILRVSYPDVRVPQWEGRRLRGFFAAGGDEGSPLHNHGEQGKPMYRYPLVQYKIIGGTPTVVAVEDGIPALQRVLLGRTELLLGGRAYPCGEVRLNQEANLVGDAEEPRPYQFRTPWFGLNQDNYRQYLQAGKAERKALLERVLAGNLIALSKGLGVTVERRLVVDAALEEIPMRFKQENVLGFTGRFSANYVIPDLLGLGKSVSRGFGAVEHSEKGLAFL